MSADPIPDDSQPHQSRLIPLNDGRPGLRGTMNVDVREPSLSSSQSAIASAKGEGGEGQGEEALNPIRENS